MSNNNSSVCNLSDTFKSSKISLYIFSSTILPSIYILFGTTLNVAAFRFFKEQLRENSAYGYQIAATVCKLLEMFATVGYNMFWNCAGGGPVGGGLEGFRSSYFLMWMTVRVIYTAQSATISLLVYMPTAISVDRALSLIAPVRYQKMNYKLHQIVATITCIVLATIATAESAFDYDPKESNGTYSIEYNPAHAATYWKIVSLNFRSAARHVSLVVLIAASCTVIYKYRKRNAVGGDLFQRTDPQQKVRRADEKALFVLVIIQCSVAGVVTLWVNEVAAAVTYFPAFFKCEGSILPTVNAVVVQIAGCADYVLMLTSSKRFRVGVMKSFKKACIGFFPVDVARPT